MKRGHLHWGVMEGLSEDMTFEWRPEDAIRATVSEMVPPLQRGGLT